MYNGTEYTFPVWRRDAWQYALDLLADPNYCKRMKWDARQLSRYDAATNEWKRFVHEPWTANLWAECQVSIIAKVLLLNIDGPYRICCHLMRSLYALPYMPTKLSCPLWDIRWLILSWQKSSILILAYTTAMVQVAHRSLAGFRL